MYGNMYLVFLITKNSRKSQKNWNRETRDFRQMPWFCQNAVAV